MTIENKRLGVRDEGVAMMPLVSVVMPVYNAEALLRESLDALVAQTFADFELICIDDGSSDGSGAILDEYAERYPFIRVFHQANIGVYPTRNAALGYVQGRYLLMVDCDDRAAPTLVEKAFYRAEAEQAEITLIGWDYLTSALSSPDVSRWHLQGWPAQAGQGKFPMGFGYLWMKLYRMDFLRRHGLRFREEFYSKADVIFHWRSMSLAKRVCVVPEVLYHYRVHENSITGTIGKRFIQSIHVMEAIKADLIALGDPKGLLPAWYPFALGFIRAAYQQLADDHRGEMEAELRAFLQRLTPEERRVYREPGRLDRDTRYFYLALESRGARLRYRWLYHARRGLARRVRGLLLPSPLRRRFVAALRRQSYTLSRTPATELRRSVAELNHTANDLAAENYELRRALEEAARRRRSG